MSAFDGNLKGWDQVHEAFKERAALKLDSKIMCKVLHICRS